MKMIFASLLVVMLLASGCAIGVSQEEYDAVLAEREALETQVQELQASIEVLSAEPPPPTFTPPSLPPLTLTEVEVIRDIEFGRVDDVPLLLDIYLPQEPVLALPMPAVIDLHSGGWESGDKSSGESMFRWLAERGFVVVSPNYRLSGEAKFPAAVEDCKCAVRWLRASAGKYGVDPDHIGVMGLSAGGHLAMMVGCADEAAGLEGTGGWEEVSSRVQAVVSRAGPSCLAVISDELYHPGYGTGKFIGFSPKEKPDLWWLASPTAHVSGDDPPLLLLYHELDEIVPLFHAQLVCESFERLSAKGRAELAVLPGLIEGKERGKYYVNNHVCFETVTEEGVAVLTRKEAAEIDYAVILDFFLEHLVSR